MTAPRCCAGAASKHHRLSHPALFVRQRWRWVPAVRLCGIMGMLHRYLADMIIAALRNEAIAMLLSGTPWTGVAL